MKELSRAMERDPETVLRDPERNIQVGCWYLEKISKDYRDTPDAEARILAAYNAGPSRAAEWNKTTNPAQPLTAEQFIARIDFPTTRSYVTAILARYRKLQAERAARDGGKR
jgi:soluble lytic murein transglycosylase